MLDAKAFLEGLFTEPRYKTPDDLPSDWRCEFEERAAIREYDGGQAREHAEAEAFDEILVRMRAAGELV